MNIVALVHEKVNKIEDLWVRLHELNSGEILSSPSQKLLFLDRIFSPDDYHFCVNNHEINYLRSFLISQENLLENITIALTHVLTMLK